MDDSVEALPVEVSSGVEKFVLDGKVYTIFNVPVNFYEADLLCTFNGVNGRLAIPDTPRKFEFLVMALAETDIRNVGTVMWVGCKMNVSYIGTAQTDKVITCLNGEVINGLNTLSESVFAPEVLADRFDLQWKGELEPPKSGLCVIIVRVQHVVPRLGALECDVPRPFACEEDPNYTGTNIIPELPVTIDNSTYYIFHASLTWDEALVRCRDLSMELASFGFNKEVKVIGQALLKARPSLENAWISGRYRPDFEDWIFYPNSDPIPALKDNLTLFPPWSEPVNMKIAGCLLLDRHMDLNPVFLPARCQRRKSFICEKRRRDEEIHVVRNGGKPFGYAIYYLNRTWHGAKQHCIKKNMTLAQPEDEEQVMQITIGMAEGYQVVSSVWLGGYKVNDWWYWATENITRRIEKRAKTDKGDYPPFIPDHTEGRLCLNMDRGDHNVAFWYSLDCKFVQYFVCQTLKFDSDVQTNPPPTEGVTKVKLVHSSTEQMPIAGRRADSGTTTPSTSTAAKSLRANIIPNNWSTQALTKSEFMREIAKEAVRVKNNVEADISPRSRKEPELIVVNPHQDLKRNKRQSSATAQSGPANRDRKLLLNPARPKTAQINAKKKVTIRAGKAGSTKAPPVAREHEKTGKHKPKMMTPRQANPKGPAVNATKTVKDSSEDMEMNMVDRTAELMKQLNLKWDPDLAREILAGNFGTNASRRNMLTRKVTTATKPRKALLNAEKAKQAGTKVGGGGSRSVASKTEPTLGNLESRADTLIKSARVVPGYELLNPTNRPQSRRQVPIEQSASIKTGISVPRQPSGRLANLLRRN